MAYEWAAPAALGLTVVGGLLGGSRLFGRVEKAAETLQDTFELFVKTNEKTHAMLFDEIKMEREKRADEDKQIRSEYVSVQLCQMIRADKPNGKAKGSGI